MRGSRPFACGAAALMAVAIAVGAGASLHGQARPRARALGVPFAGTPGPLNAITDVAGVEVGHATIVRGEGPLVVGKGPVRTGVTAMLPRGKTWEPVFAGWFAGNGFGEMTGAPWVVEGGVLGGPVMITGTYSVGVVRDAVNSWFHEVAEARDSVASAGRRRDVRCVPERRTRPARDEGARVRGARRRAAGRRGGRQRRRRHRHGGARLQGRHRHVEPRVGRLHRVGVLVQANYGTRESLTIAGVPVGREIAGADARCAAPRRPADRDGSIIVVVATDAPLLPHQLERLARRVPMGIARLGGTASNGSGDIFIAFSTANPGAAAETGVTRDHVAAERRPHAALRRDGRRHRGSDRQRARRRGDDDRHQRQHGLRAAHRPTAGAAAEVRPAFALSPDT